MTIVSYPSFCQTDTSKIEVSTDNARRAFKELIEKDHLEKQVLNLELQINDYNELIQNKELETDNLKGQVELFESVVEIKETTISNQNKIINRSENKTLFWKLTTLASLILCGIIAIN